MSRSVRVRFLMRKRYPHPHGVKRSAGDVVSMRADLAMRWAGLGIVEVIPAEVEAPVLEEAQEVAEKVATEEVPAKREAPEVSEDSADDMEKLVTEVVEPAVEKPAKSKASKKK